MSGSGEREGTWAAAQAELDRLRREAEVADLVALAGLAAAADRLVEGLRRLAEEAGLKPPPPYLEETARLLAEHLTVGPLRVPVDAPPGLAEVVRAYAGRRLGRTVRDEFMAKVGQYAEVARGAAGEVAELEGRAAAARDHLELLGRYRAALDALTAPPAGAGGEKIPAVPR